jgi:hypothetical protein
MTDTLTRTPVDTGKVTGRRTLRFNSIQDVLADVDRLAAADRADKLRALGNWTLGQALGHLATWAEYSFCGAPLKPPFLIKLILRMGKKKFLNGSMRTGVRIPKVPGGTLGTENLPLDQAMPRYRAALEHLGRECPAQPNIIFGPLTHDEWINLNLRHAELHLSFFVPS